jgi:hypothetical protein
MEKILSDFGGAATYFQADNNNKYHVQLSFLD